MISDIYATEERAKAADFITYSKVFDGVLVAKGNPKKIDRHQLVDVRRGGGREYRLCRSPADPGADAAVQGRRQA